MRLVTHGDSQACPSREVCLELIRAHLVLLSGLDMLCRTACELSSRQRAVGQFLGGHALLHAHGAGVQPGAGQHSAIPQEAAQRSVLSGNSNGLPYHRLADSIEGSFLTL